MATNEDPFKPNRRDLQKFLSDPRMVRAFEKLFQMVPQDLYDLDEKITNVSYSSDRANSAANEALTLLERMVSALETIALSPRHEYLSDECETLVIPDVCCCGGTDGSFFAPPSTNGTLSEQNADSVDISGGSISAEVTNTSDDFLVATSGTVADSAGSDVATLTNSPSSGNPTKWVAVDDNGTTRYIPTWE